MWNIQTTDTSQIDLKEKHSHKNPKYKILSPQSPRLRKYVADSETRLKYYDISYGMLCYANPLLYVILCYFMLYYIVLCCCYVVLGCVVL